MKKIFFLIGIILASLAFTGCGDDSELERLKAENDSLRNVANENKNEVEQFMAAFNEIQQNLNTIKQKEKIIDLNTTDNAEMTPDMKEQINNDILTIYELMQENEQALATLKRQLKASGIKNKQLEQTLELYEQQMKQKDEEITALKNRLEQMNFNMEELNEKIDQMAANIDTLQQIQQEQSELISQQDEALHTVYYVVGTKDELKEHNILTKSGVLSKLSLDPDFDKSYFTKTDNRNLSEIPVNAKKIQILTTHPESSFKIVEDENKNVSKIAITDKDNFWSVSKFCVILVK